MLLRCYRRMKDLDNIRCFSADATTVDWGTGYDVIVLAGNVLINIEFDMDYKQAQVYGWLSEAGLTIEKTYKNFSAEPLPEPIDESTYRATIWACKN